MIISYSGYDAQMKNVFGQKKWKHLIETSENTTTKQMLSSFSGVKFGHVITLVWHRRLLSKVCVLHSRHIAQHYLVADDASLEQYFCCDFDQQLKTRYELIAGRAEQGCPPSIPSQHYWYMVQEEDQSFSRWSFSEHTSFLQLDARKYVSITRVRYMDKHHVFWITDVHFTYKAAQKKFKKTGSAYFSNGLWRSCSIFLR